jgi:hypothetical protein
MQKKKSKERNEELIEKLSGLVDMDYVTVCNIVSEKIEKTFYHVTITFNICNKENEKEMRELILLLKKRKN